MNNLNNLAKRYVNLGTTPSMTKVDIKKAQLFNLFNLTWYGLILMMIIEEVMVYQPMRQKSIFVIIGMIVLVSLNSYLHIRGDRRIAYVNMVLLIIGLTFFFANWVYPGELLEYYFILGPSVSLILIDDRRINTFFLILSFLMMVIPNLYFHHYPRAIFNGASVAFIFFSIYAMINYFKNLNRQNEASLLAKTKELEKLDDFKSQFFTNVSHEIRTPLTIIKGHVDSLDQTISNDEDITPLKKGFHKQIDKITAIVDDVLDLAKLENDNFTLHPKVSNVGELVQRIYLSFESVYKQKDIQFELNSEAKGHYAMIDHIFMERAINNLLSNALKYTDKGGRVDLRLGVQNDQIAITISDTGIGISKEDIALITQRFYQVDNDINRAGGSGIGLAFSQEIIEKHNGQLRITSSPKEGSTFTVLLPQIAAKPQTEYLILDLDEDVRHQLNDFTIDSNTVFLLVEDNMDMRAYLKTIFINYKCIEAENGLEALKKLENEQIDFVITDYMMPKMDGLALVEAIRKNNKQIPIIMLTAKSDLSSKLEVLEQGANDYLLKPFNKDELLIRIKNIIEFQQGKKDYEATEQLEQSPYEGTDSLIADLQQYIFQNSADGALKQEDLAYQFNVSKSSLYRKIKSETGLSPNDFIKEIKLQKARQIIENKPDILLKQLAAEVGFQHTTYFSKLYQNRFGNKPWKK